MYAGSFKILLEEWRLEFSLVTSFYYTHFFSLLYLFLESKEGRCVRCPSVSQ